MDEHTPYYDALGRFLAMYARAEATAQLLLWHVSGIDLDTARIVWPSMRVKAITDTIRKLHRERQSKLPALADEALSHLLTITKVRDNLVHYATETDEKGNRYVANAHQTFHILDQPITTVSVPLLGTLTSDLSIVIMRLITQMPPGDPIHQERWEAALEGASAPFLYTPPSPEKKSRGTP